jgi:surfeit locus 1 family protein
MRNRTFQILAALSAFSVLIALGVWQMERRAWKNELIKHLEEALSSPPIAYSPAKSVHPATEKFMFGDRLVRLEGEFLNAHTVRILTPTPDTARMRTREGFGYLIFTPLKLGGPIFTGPVRPNYVHFDRFVFVNRGFVPQSLADSTPVPKGKTEITGLLRLRAPPGWFTPPPEPAKRLFFAADIPAMAAAAGLPSGHTIESEYIEAVPAPGAAEWPLPRDPRVLLASIPNRHLEYALTWFALAAAFAVIAGAAIRRGRS